MAVAAAPVVIGAGVGAGVAALTGGNIEKGALYGAAGGGVGGVLAGPALVGPGAGLAGTGLAAATTLTSTQIAAYGGLAGSLLLTKRSRKGLSLSPMPKKVETLATRSPRPQVVQLEALRERERREMKKKRGYQSTVMTRGGLGTANTQKAKVLGA